MEGESLEAGEEEDEEPVLEGLAAHEDQAEESEASYGELEALGKRKENGKDQPAKQAPGKANGQAQRPQVKPGEQPTKQKKTS